MLALTLCLQLLRVVSAQNGGVAFSTIEDPHVLGLASKAAVVALTAEDGTTRLGIAKGLVIMLQNVSDAGFDLDVEYIYEPHFTLEEAVPVTALVAFTAEDGTLRLASGSYWEAAIKLWDVSQPVVTIGVHTNYDSRYDRGARSRAYRTLSFECTPHCVHGSGLHVSKRTMSLAAFTAADGSARLASGHADGSIALWDVSDAGGTTAISTTMRSVWYPEFGGLPLAAFTAANGDARLGSGNKDGSITVWDVSDANITFYSTLTSTPVAHTVGLAEVHALTAFTAADGTARLASGSHGGVIELWDVSGTATTEYRTLYGHRTNGAGTSRTVVSLVAFTAADGTARLASGSDGHHPSTIELWDVSSVAGPNDAYSTLTEHTDEVKLAVFTAADGTSRLASVSRDHTKKLWGASIACTDGQYATLDAAKCSFCDSGVHCPENSFSSAGAGLCAVGHFCPGGGARMQPCPAGTASADVAQSAASACEACLAGRYASSGSAKCNSTDVLSMAATRRRFSLCHIMLQCSILAVMFMQPF